MKKENLSTRELLNYAKDNGYNEIMFVCKDKLFTGKFLDAYFEFVTLPLVGEDGFVTISQIEEMYGYDLKFNIIEDEEEYKLQTRVSFALRGREIPKQYLDEE